MIDTVYFMNQGLFDKNAMLTFGVSAKEDDTAIGYFGTGFKYATAIILRIGGSVTVRSMGEVFVFEKKSTIIRGQEFQIVTCNGENAGFTTHLGVNWKPWMAFRELYSNCKDEKGLASETQADFDTVIEVTCPEIAESFRNAHKYFITGKPVLTTDKVEIFDRLSEFVYYRGVAVADAGESLYSFNITSPISLSEDRQAAYQWQWKEIVSEALQSITNGAMLREILTSEDEFVKSMDYSSAYETSDEFVVMAKTLIASGVGVQDKVHHLVDRIEQTHGNFPEFELNKVQQAMMERAISFLNSIEVTVEDFPIFTVTGLGDGVMGRAIQGKIFLSDIPFDMGTKQVASTLLEEWVHNKYNCRDFDRRMQSWLFDKVLSLGETIEGSPL
jgi:hypothetical protein